MITEDELELIQWRATRGSHYAGTYIQGSKYAQQVVEEDVPQLLMEIHLLQKKIDAGGAGEWLEALKAIKAVVVGDKKPNWDTPMVITQSRMRIADICDAILHKIQEGEPSKPSDIGN